MSWLDETGFERRPLVIVEDHLYHTGDLLAALQRQRPDLLAETTVVAIDRGGPDTAATVDEWLSRYGAIQIAASVGEGERVRAIASDELHDQAAFAKLIARLLRPGGILVQDVQLSTLGFVPADRWWESIYAAATVRGLFASNPPTIRFLSNKRGYTATFGRDLADAGFDPRDVMDKSELAAAVVPAVSALVDRHFPLTLRGSLAAGRLRRWRLGPKAVARADVDQAFDLAVWRDDDSVELGGRAIAAAGGRLSLKSGSAEAATWIALVSDALESRAGIAVLEVGARLAPPGAGRAEVTNLAARHIHTLRSRLTSRDAIVTTDHRYRLKDGLRLGDVSP
jgi:hypothetical protein